jgi:hypothetical protein
MIDISKEQYKKYFDKIAKDTKGMNVYQFIEYININVKR